MIPYIFIMLDTPNTIDLELTFGSTFNDINELNNEFINLIASYMAKFSENNKIKYDSINHFLSSLIELTVGINNIKLYAITNSFPIEIKYFKGEWESWEIEDFELEIMQSYRKKIPNIS